MLNIKNMVEKWRIGKLIVRNLSTWGGGFRIWREILGGNHAILWMEKKKKPQKKNRESFYLLPRKKIFFPAKISLYVVYNLIFVIGGR